MKCYEDKFQFVLPADEQFDWIQFRLLQSQAVIDMPVEVFVSSYVFSWGNKLY